VTLTKKKEETKFLSLFLIGLRLSIRKSTTANIRNAAKFPDVICHQQHAELQKAFKFHTFYMHMAHLILVPNLLTEINVYIKTHTVFKRCWIYRFSNLHGNIHNELTV